MRIEKDEIQEEKEREVIIIPEDVRVGEFILEKDDKIVVLLDEKDDKEDDKKKAKKGDEDEDEDEDEKEEKAKKKEAFRTRRKEAVMKKIEAGTDLTEMDKRFLASLK